MKKFIFGAGHDARYVVANAFLAKNEEYDGVIVSSKEDNPDRLYFLTVYSVEEAVNKFGRNIEVTLGVSKQYKDAVKEILCDHGITNVVEPDRFSLRFNDYPDVSMTDYLQAWFFAVTGKMLDWENLRTYDEKIQWLKIFDCTDKKRDLADKYKVREFIKEKIGDKYLIPIYGTWKHFRDIEFDTLPQSFVLKCNHGSGWNEIVYDKKNIDMDDLNSKFESWLRCDYADTPGLELQYKGIDPLIIAEKLLEDDSGDVRDYKFFVFDGQVKMIQVDINRLSNHKRNIYTPEWEYIPVSIHYPSAPEVVVERPKCLSKMIEIAETLGEGFIHVRVDLYLVNGNIFFGEMTFTHGNGIEVFNPEEFGLKMGNWIKIPNQ
ncbi:MAG: glycosyltransferase [Butyrivibrio sp.]|nr:glycosyltransferase [Butyrivibrio sp.]